MTQNKARFEVHQADAGWLWVLTMDGEPVAVSTRLFDTHELAVAEINRFIGQVSAAERSDVKIVDADGEQ